ncbi:MAG: GNAT family N-acetyltransferase [Pirellulales bacterium]
MEVVTPQITVRAAVPDDVELLHSLVCELAEYEKLRDAVRATVDTLRACLFGPRPYCEALVGELNGEAAGFALFFHNYSTFAGKPGLYLEDLYVRQASRGHGLGKSLFKRVGEIAVERGCSRIEWSALDWNEPAIRFYTAQGAREMSQWRIYRLDGPALNFLAGHTDAPPQ